MTGDTETASEQETMCCEPVGAVDQERVTTDVQLLSAMGNDTRYELLRRIAGADGDVCVCDLEAAVGVSQSAVSQALSRLYTAGLVTRRKDGNWRYYGLTAQAETVLDALDAIRTEGER